MKEVIATCKVCRFFVKNVEDHTKKDGCCCRYPPKIITSLNYHKSEYPLCSIVNWCGEFSAKI